METLILSTWNGNDHMSDLSDQHGVNTTTGFGESQPSASFVEAKSNGLSRTVDRIERGRYSERK